MLDDRQKGCFTVRTATTDPGSTSNQEAPPMLTPHPSGRGLGAVALIAAAGLALAGCGSNSSSASGSAGSPKIAAVIKGLDNPFFQTMEQGIQDQSKTD